MGYIKTTWVDDNLPALNASNLNKIEQGIEDATEISNSFTATFYTGRDKTGTSFTSPNCRYVKIGSIVHLIIFRANFGAGLSVQSVTLPFTINADWLASGTTDTGVAFSNPLGNVNYVNFASAISDMFVRFSFTYKVV